jgi:PHP family Zn ribbon phosphoesterase
MSPSESKKNGNICPVCKKRLTIGVMHRVEQLADRPEGFIPENAIPYIHLIPLDEIIANAMKRGVSSDAVRREYQKLLAYFKSEFNVLLDASYEEISKITYERVASGIMKMRSGKVNIKPGYDGVYGEIELFGGGEESRKGQKKLDEFLA